MLPANSAKPAGKQGLTATSSQGGSNKYLNNLVEQDYCFIKCLLKPGLDLFSFETAGEDRTGI